MRISPQRICLFGKGECIVQQPSRQLGLRVGKHAFPSLLQREERGQVGLATAAGWPTGVFGPAYGTAHGMIPLPTGGHFFWDE